MKTTDEQINKLIEGIKNEFNEVSRHFFNEEGILKMDWHAVLNPIAQLTHDIEFEGSDGNGINVPYLLLALHQSMLAGFEVQRLLFYIYPNDLEFLDENAKAHKAAVSMAKNIPGMEAIFSRFHDVRKANKNLIIAINQSIQVVKLQNHIDT